MYLPYRAGIAKYMLCMAAIDYNGTPLSLSARAYNYVSLLTPIVSDVYLYTVPIVYLVSNACLLIYVVFYAYIYTYLVSYGYLASYAYNYM